MKYPFEIHKETAEEYTFWVAKSLSLKGCIGQGDTKEAAILELERNETEWINTAAETGIPIPNI